MKKEIDLMEEVRKSFMEIKKDVCVNFINKSN